MSRQADRAAYDLRDLMSATEALLRSTASYTGAEIDDARAKLARQLKAMGSDAGRWNRRAREQYREMAGATDEYVHQHPWGMVGLAIGLGLIVGVGMGACRHRR
jgi:ElaB/YqjD/DUF883 family membrane-anchored ribosome-binding protein